MPAVKKLHQSLENYSKLAYTFRYSLPDIRSEGEWPFGHCGCRELVSMREVVDLLSRSTKVHKSSLTNQLSWLRKSFLDLEK
jgi:hypothetical protein